MKVIDLAANQPRQFYRGGALLSSFRGTAVQDKYRPEDWIASTTVRNGAAGDEGLTVLPDGRLLRDAVREDPEAWLGPEHAAALGADPALLVKLLDAGERLVSACNFSGGTCCTGILLSFASFLISPMDGPLTLR